MSDFKNTFNYLIRSKSYLIVVSLFIISYVIFYPQINKFDKMLLNNFAGSGSFTDLASPDNDSGSAEEYYSFCWECEYEEVSEYVVYVEERIEINEEDPAVKSTQSLSPETQQLIKDFADLAQCDDKDAIAKQYKKKFEKGIDPAIKEAERAGSHTASSVLYSIKASAPKIKESESASYFKKSVQELDKAIKKHPNSKLLMKFKVSLIEKTKEVMCTLKKVPGFMLCSDNMTETKRIMFEIDKNIEFLGTDKFNLE